MEAHGPTCKCVKDSIFRKGHLAPVSLDGLSRVAKGWRVLLNPVEYRHPAAFARIGAWTRHLTCGRPSLLRPLR